MSLPTELAEVFQKQFSFPQKPLFGAVATHQATQPGIRTMRIYDFDREGCPILTTHTGSKKWGEFVSHPHVSIVLVSENQLVQVIVSGKLRLDTIHTARELATHYWDRVRPDVKKVYDASYRTGDDYQEIGPLFAPVDVPTSFGIVSVMPSFWELLHLESDYPLSQRYQFHRQGEGWAKRRVNLG
jgi:pyridoxine/pyridoxamine 5'-phosphate oxidase